ncbi:MAG: ABC transporter ATP-binding protein [Herpetosiphonaceae bacterium]|nr:ABC transporter ATP-binding protein [Herpetosiphonaceae bacterium]
MPPIIETRDLTKRYGTVVALDRLNLLIPAGAIYGFIGPNGAGKTTTMRILTGLLAATSGQALVAGHDVAREPMRVRRLVGWMPDSFGVYDNMKVWEYLDFFAASMGVPALRRKQLVTELLDLVDLSHKRDAYVMELSRGMQQRLSLARTMAHEPQLLILDEPASGLDPRARIELRELLKELRVMGKTILISSHILTELAEMCTHVGIIERGHLLVSGEVGEVLHALQPHKLVEIRVLARAEQALALLPGLPGVRAARRVAPLPDPVLDPARPADDDGPATLNVDYVGDGTGLSVVFKALAASGVPVVHFAEQSSDLEDMFMQVTQGLAQ